MGNVQVRIGKFCREFRNEIGVPLRDVAGPELLKNVSAFEHDGVVTSRICCTIVCWQISMRCFHCSFLVLEKLWRYLSWRMI